MEKMNTARILIVEDETLVSLEIERQLKRLGYEPVARAASGKQAIALADAHRPDLVLMDIRLAGDMDGIDAAREICRRIDTSIIFLTAYSEDDTLNRAKLSGAHGYIIKPFHDRDLKSSIEITLHRHQAEDALRESEKRYRTLFENSTNGIFLADSEGSIHQANPVAIKILGWSETDSGVFLDAIHPQDRDRIEQAFNGIFSTGVPADEKFRYLHPDGNRRWIHMRLHPVADAGAQSMMVEGIAEDVTFEKETEDCLRIERDVAVRLGTAEDMMTSFQVMLDGCLQVEEIHAGAVFLFDSESGNLKININKGFSQEIIGKYALFASDSPQAGIVSSGRTHYLPPPPENTEAIWKDLTDDGFLSLGVIPIRADTEIVGALAVGSRFWKRIPDRFQLFYDSMALKIASVISRIRTNDKLRLNREQLQEANTAMKVLLRQRQADREDLEAAIVNNIRQFALPCLEKLSRCCKSDQQKVYIELLETHLREITSTYFQKVSTEGNLTPSEIRIADFIRQGRSSKDIALVLGISEAAVQFHRRGIRKKLGMYRKKVNLQSYLKVPKNR